MCFRVIESLHRVIESLLQVIERCRAIQNVSHPTTLLEILVTMTSRAFLFKTISLIKRTFV